MRLWTVQSYEWYEKLINDGHIYCDTQKSDNITENNFSEAYLWMANQLSCRIGPAPKGVDYPLWAWAVLDGSNERPDLRRMEFNLNIYPSVLIELEVPDEHVLLTDEQVWNIIMSRIMNSNPLSDEDISLESLFAVDINDSAKGTYIQACFWEAKAEYIRSYRIFGKRK